MKTAELAAKLGATIVTGKAGIDKEIKGVYCCDLLSWVMSHAGKDSAWITVHTHMNIVAVAVLSEIACIIIPEGIEAEEATIKKAVQENIPILCTGLTAYEVCCIAHDCGI
ncbi:MAG: DRTGG domain-containing protein [Acetivibrionales bacterium]|jgi:predicted transcriptional regulator|nr:AraC family transcriptional regulator [Clostridiaceae bacterium]HOA54130.1 DRTGG domain-containing protein [Clostridiales bacterium]HQD30136.1 DRTGG domain-containing protein [Clostridiales bacterium]